MTREEAKAQLQAARKVAKGLVRSLDQVLALGSAKSLAGEIVITLDDDVTTGVPMSAKAFAGVRAALGNEARADLGNDVMAVVAAVNGGLADAAAVLLG